MMVQKIQDINPIWTPDFKSFSSECCFMAFSSGLNTFWSDGKMVFNDTKAVADTIHFHEVRRIYCGDSAPDWACAAVDIVDRSLPDVETILRSLDDGSMVLSSNPAVFRLPQSPYRVDLAKCVFAARIFLKCKDHIVLPVEYSEEECLEDLSNASYLCSILGGEWSLNVAAGWACDPRSYA